MTTDPAALAQLPPAYLQEDIGYRLVSVAITFMVLTTVVICLFYTSRYLNNTLRGWECWAFLPLGYAGGIASCVSAIREFSSGLKSE
jgi:hypothetical protein